MLRHTILIAIRNFKKNKSSFLINTIGLSSGLACVVLIFLWINDEYKVDAFHEKNDVMYQVMTNFDSENKVITMDNSSFLLGGAMETELPEVESATLINADFITPKGIVSIGENDQLGHGIFASPNFFENFSFDLLIGEKSKVLLEKNSVVLSENLARKLFINPQEAIGKIVEWDYKWSDGSRKITVKVSGIFKNIPSNSTLQFEAVVPSDLLKEASRWVEDWNGGYAKTFVFLKDGTDIDKFNKKIEKYLSTKVKNREMFALFVQKFSDRYLKTPYENGVQAGGRITYVRLFALIAFLILLIACINFMNLSTAQASKRLKEIGVKKVLGGRQKTLIMQFIGESFVLTLISAIVALVLVFVVLPYFNQITAKDIQLIFSQKLIFGLLLLVTITGFLAGSYPAFYLSSFKPITVFKGKLNISFGDVWIRKGLVIFQFTLAVVFIVSVFIIKNQMDFIMQKNLGYQRDNTLRFDINADTDKLNTFINELQNIPGVASASFMNGSVLDGLDSQSGFSWGGVPSDKNIMFQSPRVGYGLIETLGITLIEGRTFSKDFNDDHHKIILNASAVKLMNLENPVGTILDKSGEKMEIVGVVEDFQYGSLHKRLEPLILRFRDFGSEIVLKLNGATSAAVLNQIEAVYGEFQPGYPFEFSFLDSDYQQLYEAEQRVALLSKIFAAFVVLISCLGLLGLAVFNSEQRRKEIGIRKVLGASVLTVVKLLSRDFLKLIVISIIIAIPMAWLILTNWLQGFAYHVEISGWIFIIASISVILIAMITVSFQAIKVAISNPVDSLKTE